MRSYCILSLATLLLTPAVPAAVLYHQTAIGVSPRTADYGTATQFGFRMYDDFTLGSGGVIDKVTWRGLYLGDIQPAPAPSEDVTSWRISFHADNSGMPGAELALAILAAADVTSTYQGTGVFSNGQNVSNISYYQYSADLPAFYAGPGTKYWIGFLGISENFSPFFALLGASGGDNSSVQEELGAGMAVTSTNVRAADRAFTLEGTVPEPSTYALLGLGLALGFARKRLS